MALDNKLGEVYVDLEARTAKFNRRIKETERNTEKSAKRMELSLGRITKSLVGAFGITWGAAQAVNAFKGIINASSDLEESANKAREVFGRSFGSIEVFARKAAEAIGETKQQAFALTGEIGNLLTSFGLTDKAAADLSIQVVQLAADLGSFNNVRTEEALYAIRSALVGQSEPMLRFGADTRVTRLEQVALKYGLIEAGEAMDAQARALAAVRAIMIDTEKAQGDFDRTSKSLANASKTLGGNIGTLAGKIGDFLTPSVGGVVIALNDMLGVINKIGESSNKNLTPAIDAAANAATQQMNDLIEEIQAANKFIREVPDDPEIIPSFEKLADVNEDIITNISQAPKMAEVWSRHMNVLKAYSAETMESWDQIYPLVEGTAEIGQAAANAGKDFADETERARVNWVGLSASVAQVVKSLSGGGGVKISDLLQVAAFIPGPHQVAAQSASVAARALGFQSGTHGQYLTVPPGFSNDSFRVGLSSGERFKVIPAGDTVTNNNNSNVTIVAPELRWLDDDFTLNTRVAPKLRRTLGI